MNPPGAPAERGPAPVRVRRAVSVDRSLLAGVRFGCRPGCGLCCYATPAVSPPERSALLRIEPELPFVRSEEENPFVLLAARPGGGACWLLSEARCRHHGARPFPCRSYPVMTHIGARAQLGVVLSCPGVELGFLDRFPAAGVPPEGLGEELAAVERELSAADLDGWCAEGRAREERVMRRLARRGEGIGAEEVRNRWRDRPVPLRFDPDRAIAPPPADRPVEELPIFYDSGHGRVAIRTDPEGRYELLSVPENGVGARRIGVYAPPDEMPVLRPPARRRLEGYLRLLIERDHFLWSAYLELWSGAGGRLEERLEELLGEATTEVIRRAAVRAVLKGEPDGALGVAEIEDGIRATDADLLDRPTLGRIL